MNKYKIAIEIDIMKLLVVAGMAVSFLLASICGEGETLFLIVPAGLAYRSL